jgi:hypothetical protein
LVRATSIRGLHGHTVLIEDPETFFAIAFLNLGPDYVTIYCFHHDEGTHGTDLDVHKEPTTNRNRTTLEVCGDELGRSVCGSEFETTNPVWMRLDETADGLVVTVCEAALSGIHGSYDGRHLLC